MRLALQQPVVIKTSTQLLKRASSVLDDSWWSENKFITMMYGLQLGVQPSA